MSAQSGEKEVDSHVREAQGNGSQSHESSFSRAILFKLDVHALPSLTLLWLAAFIDRANIGNANVAGLGKDLGLHGLQFNTALACFYILYIVIELPSGYALRRLGGKVWLPFLVFCWGIVTICSGWMSNYAGLICVRLALGLCEGGLLPGIVYYLSTMYKRRELQLRVGIFYSAASLSGAFGGLLAFVIIKMNGIRGRPGWAWIFILEGCATVLIALFAWWQMPNGIANAPFLSAEQKEYALNRVKADFVETLSVQGRGAALGASSSLTNEDSTVEKDKGDAPQTIEHARSADATHGTSKPDAPNPETEEFEWAEVIRGFKDPQVWITGISYMSICVVLYSISLFLPTIINGLGYSGAQSQLHSAYPYLPAAGLTVVAAFFCDRYQLRGPFILATLPITAVGYILAIATESNRVRYAAVFLMAAGVYPSVPAVLCIVANNSSGQWKRNTCAALQLMLCNLAGFIASFQYTSTQAPRYVTGHSIALAFTCLAWILVAINCAYCLYENRQRAAGKRDGNVDAWLRLVAEGQTRAPIGDRDPAWRFYL